MVDFLNEGAFEGYTLSLCDELCKSVNLKLCCCCSQYREDKHFEMLPFFFKKSDKMKKGFWRKIVRFFEYYQGYKKLLKYVKKEKVDVLHFQWLRCHFLDCLFIKKISKNVSRKIYTSHDVFDHVKGKKEVKSNKKIHALFDAIIVHGETIKKEYLEFYPEDEQKLFVQYHGVYADQKKRIIDSEVSNSINEFLTRKHNVVVVFLGHIFYNKGPDRLLKYWIEKQKETDNLLLVAGNIRESYTEFDELNKEANSQGNILVVPRFVNDSEFAFIMENATIVALPYRHASMSGVLFSAANFSKSVLFTTSGSLSEYINSNYCFECNNDYNSFSIEMDKLLSCDVNFLLNLGNKFGSDITSRFSWESIAYHLFKDIYCCD